MFRQVTHVPGLRNKVKFVASENNIYPSLERGEIKPGTVLVIRYEGPKGAPGMPEVAYSVCIPYTLLTLP